MSAELRRRLDEAFEDVDRVTRAALAAVHDHSALSFELEAQIERQLADRREDVIRLVVAADRLKRHAP